VVSIHGKTPQHETTEKEQPQPNPQRNGPIEVEQKTIEGEETHGVVPQMSPIPVQKGVGEYARQSLN
jgi:hypothetical protein